MNDKLNKYKVEFTQTGAYVVDVFAVNELEAKEIAKNAWEKIKKQDIEHYYQYGDIEEEITTVYDVTGTDDPFNPEN